jgi:hypothetical protein
MKDGGMEIVHMDWMLGHFHSEFVGGSINHPSPDPAASQQHGEGGVMVIPARLAILFVFLTNF